jgi:XTP/dITP diphosphohydrolase
VKRLTYLLATRSHGKLRELRELFNARGIDVIDLADAGLTESPDEESIESWETFEENALAKAQYFYMRSGMPTFADDSGLAVDALAGRPGVRSKRWAGVANVSGRALDAANNDALQAEIRRHGGFPSPAEYVCAAAFADDARTLVRVGRTAGEIIHEPAGDEGFGYDPYFRSVELGKTFGMATVREKRGVSHRGRAFAALLEALFPSP